MNIDFAGQSVLVAGAARGIGRGIVEAFAARGASVFAGDRLRDEMAGLPAHQTQLDLLDKAQVRAWIAESAAASGHSPDVLVYVAGGVLGQSATPLEDVDEAAWRAVLDVNLTGAFLSAQAVTPGMKQAGRGRIVFIASGAGLRTSLTGIQAYASAKAGEIGLARQLGQELGPFGITVNAVAPGFQRTSPDYERQWQSYSPERQDGMIANTARRRAGTPQDIAHAVMFLASDYADFITGQTLSVTGSP
ncbi:MAG: SDR family NAD(P)-dependent oxidoreductase [Novosphingobium sp.]|jgi:3-oxoacyl-[acyl-carrier protein] reductase|uniref:SDR family NAD(P)-dependent oxidoreductase n=1 Tax=Novosphingobium sp. TaxID=1874826 RepID=UPI0022C5CED0|nr:SDR family NAD(P)-dependent oxidoreductase [Novosphingobium sp.]MCZ8036131.1 SDR family NAD(P)-dependent oxidoreductase [Novosphingobium sp.]